MNTLLHLAVLTVTVLALARILPGIKVKSWGSALVVALVFSVLNWMIGWLVTAISAMLLLLPAILTLGLAFVLIPFVVNTFLLWATDKLLDRFEVRDGKTLFIGASIITVVNGLFALVTRR